MNLLYITPEFSTSKEFLSGKSLPTGMPGQTKFLEYLKNSDHNVLVLAQMKNCNRGTWQDGKLNVHYFPWFLNNFIMKLLFFHVEFPTFLSFKFADPHRFKSTFVQHFIFSNFQKFEI